MSIEKSELVPNQAGTDEQWPPTSRIVDLPAFQALMRENTALQNGPDSMAWQINGEIVMVLGWGRAILMQVAHPRVGEGVAAHSRFATSTQAKVERFQHTLNRMLQMTFGTPEEAWQAGRAIDAIHGRVNGQLPDQPVRYTARDPELLKWVSATFTDSMLKTYERFVRPLSRAEKDEYVRQASIAAPLVGAPLGSFPATDRDLQLYIQQMLNSGTLRVTPRTRQVADYVLDGLPIQLLQGVNAYSRLPVIGMLPPALRQLYGFKWTRLDESLLDSTAWTYRRLHPILPTRLRRWPIAIQAEARYSKTGVEG